MYSNLQAQHPSSSHCLKYQLKFSNLFGPVRKDSIKYFALVRNCLNLFTLFLKNYEITGIRKWSRVLIRLYKICSMCPILMHDTTGVDITQSLALQPDLFTEVAG